MSIQYSTLLAIISFSAGGFTQSSNNNLLHYSVDEESPAGKFIADLKSDTRIFFSSNEIISRRNLFILASLANASFFDLNQSSGILRTSVVIDRDAICPNREKCLLFADFIIAPGNQDYCKVSCFYRTRELQKRS